MLRPSAYSRSRRHSLCCHDFEPPIPMSFAFIFIESRFGVTVRLTRPFCKRENRSPCGICEKLVQSLKSLETAAARRPSVARPGTDQGRGGALGVAR
jgi:hypothetical protein